MNDRKEKINQLIEGKSKMTVADCNEASKEIYELYNETNNGSLVAQYLFQGTYRVADEFLESYYKLINQEKQSEIINEIIKEVSIKKDRVSKSATGFSIVSTLFNLGIQESVLDILNKTIELAETGSGFSISIYSSFKKHLLDPTGKGIFTLDYSNWSKYENQRLLRLIKGTEKNLETTPFYMELTQWVETYIGETLAVPIGDAENSKEKIGGNLNPQPATEKHKSVNLEKENSQAEELMKTLLLATEETQKLFNTIFSKNISLQKLQTQLQNKEAEILEKKQKIEQQNTERTSMNNEIEMLKELLEDKEAKIKTLDERLKESFQSDDISKNQELITLKKNISSAIKLQYEDYTQNQDAECNEDNYEALKTNLNIVFRALNRYGIEM